MRQATTTDHAYGPENEKYAAGFGFQLAHMGGGCMAFRIGDDTRYALVTEDEEGPGWLAGCYNSEAEEQGEPQRFDRLRDALHRARAMVGAR